MTPEQREFLDLRVKPGIIGFLESSYITGIHIDGLIFLEKVGHFRPLANPPPGAQRYFLTNYVLKVAQDDKWATKAIRLIRDNSHRRNQAKKHAKNGNQRRGSLAFDSRS